MFDRTGLNGASESRWIYRGEDRSRLTLLRVAFGAFVLMAIFSSSTVAPSVMGNLLLFASLVALVACSMAFGHFRMRLPKHQAGMLLAVVILLYVNMLHEPLTAPLHESQVVRLPILVFASFVCLFYLPRVIDPVAAMSTIAAIAAGVVVLALPSLAVGAYSIGWIEVAPYNTFRPFFLPVEVPQLTSFYGDTNALSKVALVGSFASLFVLVAGHDRRLYRATLALCVFGVYFTNSRGALVSLLVGGFVAACYGFDVVEDGRLVVAGMVVGSVVGFALLVPVGPRIDALVDITLSSRGEAWTAAIAATLDSPLIGNGIVDPRTITAQYVDPAVRPLSPQNTFLYMAVASGVVGGALYFLFVATSLLYPRNDDSTGTAVLVGLCSALFVLMYFEILPFFGLNQISILASLSYGYLLAERS